MSLFQHTTVEYFSRLYIFINLYSKHLIQSLFRQPSPCYLFHIKKLKNINKHSVVHVYITRIRSYLVNSCRSPPLLSWNLDKGPTIYKANTVNLLRIKIAHRLDPISFTLSGKNADGINTTPIYLLEKISHKQS